MVARGKVERRRLADPADDDCILVGEAVGGLVVGRVRDAGEQLLPPCLEAGELVLELL